MFNVEQIERINTMAKENILPSVEPIREESLSTPTGRKLSVAGLSAASLVDSCEEQGLPVLWPYMHASLGASIGQLGLVSGVSKFAMTLMYPIWGYAADRFSRKMLLIWFTGIWGLWTLGISLAGSFPQLLILRVLSGLGLGVFVPAAFSLIGDLFDHESRGRAIGIVRGVGMLGLLFAVVLLPALAERESDGWRTGFALMGFASFITGLLMFGIREPTRGASEPELRDVITKKAALQYTFKWADLKALFKIKSWRHLLLNEVLTKSSSTVFSIWVFTWFTELGLDQPVYYSIILMISGGLIGGTFFFGWLGDHLEGRFPGRGRILMIQIGLAVWVPCTIGFLLSGRDDIARLFILGFLSALSNGTCSEGALWPVAQAILPPELRGNNRAIIGMVVGVVSALMLSWSGLVVDRVGVTSALLWLFPGAILLSIFAWIPMFRTYPRDRAALHELLMQRRAELIEQNT
jgi:MFS family permease